MLHAHCKGKCGHALKPERSKHRGFFKSEDNFLYVNMHKFLSGIGFSGVCSGLLVHRCSLSCHGNSQVGLVQFIITKSSIIYITIHHIYTVILYLMINAYRFV